MKRSRHSEGLPEASGLQARVRGLYADEVVLPLLEGALLGYPEGTLGTPPLPPGCYDVEVFALRYAFFRPVTWERQAADWTFEGLATGGRATVLPTR